MRLRADGLEGFRIQLEDSPVREWLHSTKEDDGLLFLEGPVGAYHAVIEGGRQRVGRIGDDPSFALAPALEIPSARVLRGRVTTPAGGPVRGALVDFGHARTRTNADGEFELEPVGEDLDHVLTAWVTTTRTPRRS